MSGYAPVGAVVYNAYWREHYTVLSHNANGTVTVRWHGDARVSNPRGVRETTHMTPMDKRDKIVSA